MTLAAPLSRAPQETQVEGAWWSGLANWIRICLAQRNAYMIAAGVIGGDLHTLRRRPVSGHAGEARRVREVEGAPYIGICNVQKGFPSNRPGWALYVGHLAYFRGVRTVVP